MSRKTPSQIDKALAQYLPLESKGLRDEWGWTLAGVASALLALCATEAGLLELRSTVGGLAGGLLALMAVGVSSMLAFLPLLLEMKSPLRDSEPRTLWTKLMAYVTVQWVNMSWLMFASAAGCLVALVSGTTNEQFGDRVSCLMAGLTVVALRRWWLLVKAAADVIALSIQVRLDQVDAKGEASSESDGPK